MAGERPDPTGEVAFEPSREFVESTNVRAFMREHGIEDYEELIERTSESREARDWFWDELVDYLGVEFYRDYDRVRDDARGPQFTEWYPGGELNVAQNVVDRHAAVDAENRNRVACIWEGEPGDVREVTYHDLHRGANRVANALEARGIETGDTVGLYMPMVPEVISILYGCFKVGAIAVPIFSGFGTDAVATRIEDAECTVLFTGDGFYRRGDPVYLKESADDAIERAGHVEHTVVYDRFGSRGGRGRDGSGDGGEGRGRGDGGQGGGGGGDGGGGEGSSGHEIPWDDGQDEWWDDAVGSAGDAYETKSLDASQESMLLYSSGTTGTPKGIVHTHAGALLQAAKEIHFGMDAKPADRFFWVSDVGWMMGPWMLIGNHHFGNTTFMYEGAPDHPRPDRFWEMIDRHALTHFGVSPTAIRALRKHGDEWLSGHDLSSLRILGSTGEPWDPESWQWFLEEVGGGEAPIMNISGGTEIMGCFLMPMPIQPLKPCTLGGPGLGMAVDVVDDEGRSIRDDHERGHLVARDSCPSMTKSLWGGDERYLREYWSTWEGLWDHGDWAQVDEDGFWFLHGRADDALNVAGRKVGPAEVEGALIDHPAVNQAAAIGVPDDTTGTAVVVYVVLEPDVEPTDGLGSELREHVGDVMGKPFRPREVRFVDEFPKTQSGKIVRRAVRAAHLGEDAGDRSSIENPGAIERIREAAR